MFNNLGLPMFLDTWIAVIISVFRSGLVHVSFIVVLGLNSCYMQLYDFKFASEFRLYQTLQVFSSYFIGFPSSNSYWTSKVNRELIELSSINKVSLV